MTWAQFCALFETPPRTNEKHRAFFKLPKTEQDRLKAMDGWFLGGAIQGKNRRKKAIQQRDIITIDIDECTPELYQLIRDGILEIGNYEYVAHTTRKHTSKNPRVRLNFPLTTPAARDNYDAVSRILAHKIDHSMDAVDDVSYRVAQMMFMPTCSKDQEYESWVNKGKLLDPDELLESWPTDWRDFANLPYSESRGQKRPTADKAEDPWSKRSPIGAFCRAYPIEDAIAKFLPDIYIPGDMNSGKPRYSYTEGSTTNGVVVEDDGRFIYSHHGTDPCSDTLCNSFDMVRLHLYGSEDEGKDLEDKPVTEFPSYKSMFKFAKEDREVQKELVEDEIDIESMFDDISDMDDEEKEQTREFYETGEDVDAEIREILGENPEDMTKDGLPPYPGSNPPKKPKKGWVRDLEVTDEGKIKSTLYNVGNVVANDPRCHGTIARNVFSGQICARRAIKSKIELVPEIVVEDRAAGLQWTNEHDDSIRMIMEAPSGKGQPGYGMKVSDRDLMGGIRLVAKQWEYHPVIDHLLKLKWDGQPRVETLFIDYLGCPDTPYHRETARQFLTAMIARLFCPGHKFDFMPVLAGEQGVRKTTFVESLAFNKWAGELTADMDGDKEAVEQMLGNWIMEVGELVSMRRSEIESQKSFISRRVDDVRLAYDKRNTRFYRQCLFIGTTNEYEYLKDTKNRRFWPIEVKVDSIETVKLDSEIELIWAEALILYKELVAKHDYQKIPFGLAGEALAEAELKQEVARVESADDQAFARVEHFLTKSIDLTDLDGDDFSDLDVPDATVIRVKTCGEQLVHEALQESPRSTQAQNSWSQVVGRTMKRMPGWVPYSEYTSRRGKKGHTLKIGDYGKQRAYVLADATQTEIAQGYRIVEDDLDDVL
ncbi:MAG: virulence-associated E family protein [Pseudomonadota bacterium]